MSSRVGSLASIAKIDVRRRTLLAGLVAVALAGCARITQRPEPAPDPTGPTVDEWQAQGVALVTDALNTLRTFEVFAAYRVSTFGSSSPSKLVWDPPTSTAWDSATSVSRGLHDRANQLFQAITTASIDPALWRTQRTLAESTHDLIGVGDALQAYRDRADRLPPGDASGAPELLDRAWSLWERVAQQWGMARSEPVNCQG